MEVGLGPGDFVFDGDAAPTEKRARPHPIFGPCLLWPTVGWIKMPFDMEVNLGPGDVVLDGVAAPPEIGTDPSFRSMSIVAKRLYVSGYYLVRR